MKLRNEHNANSLIVNVISGSALPLDPGTVQYGAT